MNWERMQYSKIFVVSRMHELDSWNDDVVSLQHSFINLGFMGKWTNDDSNRYV